MTKTVLSVCVLAVVITIGFYACKKPNEGINLIVNTSVLVKAPTLIQFSNANPNSPTPLPNGFKVTITGTGAQYLQVDGGGTNFTVNSGYLPLSLTRNAAPAPNNPVTFNIYANVPGYLPISKTVIITKDSLSTVQIPLTEYANPVAGTTILSSQVALTAGTSGAETLKTNPAAGPGASLNIAAGTQMLDASGAVINTSVLSANIVQYNTNSPSAVLSMPSTAAMNVIGPGGTVLEGETHFVFGGMLSISMTAGNTQVKKFSKPIQTSIDLPAGYSNIATGNVVVAGDVIPVWSQDDQTGQYTYEGTATVTAKGAGLVANFAISHLSNWSLGQYYLFRDKSGALLSPCKFGLRVNLNANKIDKIGTYQMALVDAQGNIINWTASTLFQTSTAFSIQLSDTYALANTKILVYYCDFQHYYDWVLVGTSTPISSLCSGTVNVAVNNNPAVLDYINVKLSLTAKCANKNVIAAPSGWFYIYDNTFTRYASAIYLENGKIVDDRGGYAAGTASNSGDLAGGTAQLINGHSYTYIINYADATYATSAFTVSKSSFSIPQTNAGGALSGTTVYNSGSNTLSVTATYIMANCN